MKKYDSLRPGPAVVAGILLVACASVPAWGADPVRPSGTASGASQLGGALPGGAVLSARSVTLVPVAGGAAVSTPIAADGSFKAVGLAPGLYRLSLSSVTVPKQTQGATFGERVNSGIATAGSAVAQGTGARHDTAKNSVANIRGREQPAPPAASGTDSTAAAGKIDQNGMPNRISMNVTTPKLNRVVEVDGAAVDTEVGPDGTLSGRVTAQ